MSKMHMFQKIFQFQCLCSTIHTINQNQNNMRRSRQSFKMANEDAYIRLEILYQEDLEEATKSSNTSLLMNTRQKHT